MAEAPKMRGIVRILQTDVEGHVQLEQAMRKIKGVSFMFARSVCIAMEMDGKKKIGLMSEHEIKKIEEFIKDPQLPTWLLNRRKDLETGKDAHINMSQLILKTKEDVNLMRRTRSYRGMRHEQGQPVRGQRTRSTFRTNKAIGVAKKKGKKGK